jgi:hypothetical protein
MDPRVLLPEFYQPESSFVKMAKSLFEPIKIIEKDQDIEWRRTNLMIKIDDIAAPINGKQARMLGVKRAIYKAKCIDQLEDLISDHLCNIKKGDDYENRYQDQHESYYFSVHGAIKILKAWNQELHEEMERLDPKNQKVNLHKIGFTLSATSILVKIQQMKLPNFQMPTNVEQGAQFLMNCWKTSPMDHPTDMDDVLALMNRRDHSRNLHRHRKKSTEIPQDEWDWDNNCPTTKSVSAMFAAPNVHPKSSSDSNKKNWATVNAAIDFVKQARQCPCKKEILKAWNIDAPTQKMQIKKRKSEVPALAIELKTLFSGPAPETMVDAWIKGKQMMLDHEYRMKKLECSVSTTIKPQAQADFEI